MGDLLSSLYPERFQRTYLLILVFVMVANSTSAELSSVHYAPTPPEVQSSTCFLTGRAPSWFFDHRHISLCVWSTYTFWPETELSQKHVPAVIRVAPACSHPHLLALHLEEKVIQGLSLLSDYREPRKDLKEQKAMHNLWQCLSNQIICLFIWLLNKVVLGRHYINWKSFSFWLVRYLYQLYPLVFLVQETLVSIFFWKAKGQMQFSLQKSLPQLLSALTCIWFLFRRLSC